MNHLKNKIVSNEEALKIFSKLGKEYSIVPNPDFIHPQYDFYPLAKKNSNPVDELKAIVMDMDGTTTTTEELCIHSLEFMIRRISGKLTKDSWSGLDHDKDLQHIIGNSTTKHVEYLVNTYKSMINKSELAKSFISSAAWTFIYGKDAGRKKEVALNIENLLSKEVLEDKKFNKLFENDSLSEKQFSSLEKYLEVKYLKSFKTKNSSDVVKACVDIYYQRYHEILAIISNGEGNSISESLLGSKEKHLIEPMPGVGILLAMVKGHLGSDIKSLIPLLLDNFLDDKLILTDIEKKLVKLSKYYEKNPLKISVVTSSIFYEANIVMTEVFKVLKEQVKGWNIPAEKKRKIATLFSSYKNVYDTFVTASDSNEIRLKPHRDLYSIALYQLGISKNDFNKVLGLEDSESGTFAIRAAGIGLCVAVPFDKTNNHNLEAAAYTLKYGLPELIIKHNLFIK